MLAPPQAAYSRIAASDLPAAWLQPTDLAAAQTAVKEAAAQVEARRAAAPAAVAAAAAAAAAATAVAAAAAEAEAAAAAAAWAAEAEAAAGVGLGATLAKLSNPSLTGAAVGTTLALGAAGAVSGAPAGTLSASRALLSGAEPCAVAGSLAVSASLRAIGVVGPFAVPEAAGGAARSAAAVAKPCSEIRQPAQLMRLLLQGIVSGLVTPATLRDRGCSPM